jgi:polysaccharide export outer membrane protein
MLVAAFGAIQCWCQTTGSDGAPTRIVLMPGSSESSPTSLPAKPLGANDLITIFVYDAPEFSRSVRVATDGTIKLPIMKHRIAVQGLMPSECETKIAQALRDEKLLNDPFVTVAISEYQSRPVNVSGEVKSPITFQATADLTLLEAINRAGGLTDTAGPEILITRKSPENSADKPFTRRIPISGLIDHADPELNIKLTGGEDVRVPAAGKIFVFGNVNKPGAYRAEDSGQNSVLTFLAKAEGLTAYSAKKAYIYRKDDKTGKTTEVPVELYAILKRRSPDVPMQVDDLLYVPDNDGSRRRGDILKTIAGIGTAATGGIVYGIVH